MAVQSEKSGVAWSRVDVDITTCAIGTTIQRGTTLWEQSRSTFTKRPLAAALDNRMHRTW